MADQDKHDKTADEKTDMETTVNGELIARIFESLDIAIDRNNTSISDLKTIENAVAINTNKKGISSSQESAIAANTLKTGISTAQASAITANTAKTGITTTQAGQIVSQGKQLQQFAGGSLPVSSGDLIFTFDAKTGNLTFTWRSGKTIKRGTLRLS